MMLQRTHLVPACFDLKITVLCLEVFDRIALTASVLFLAYLGQLFIACK